MSLPVRRDVAPPPGTAGSPRRLPRAAAFWLVAATTAALLAASSAPSPLYAVYRVAYGFSAGVLTLIFAVYVVLLLGALLTVGRLSDVMGRRPVLAGALVLEAGSVALFLASNGVGVLFAARAVQGLATGAALGVLGAYLLDLQPGGTSRLGSLVNSAAPTAGLAVGALLSGLLVAYAPHPLRLVFVVLLAAFVLLVVAVAVLPETVERTGGALRSLRPRVVVPAAAGRAFSAAIPTMMATWALGGLMLSIGGSVLTISFGQHNVAVVGAVLALFAGSGAVSSVLARNASPGPMARWGTVLLASGTALFLVALATLRWEGSFTVFVLGAAVAGAGFGCGFLGSLRAVTQLAQPHERAGLLSAVYLVSYLAFSVPAVVAGFLVDALGLQVTALVYGGVVLLAALTGLGFDAVSARRR